MNIDFEVQKSVTELKKMAKKVTNELKRAPEGKLIISKGSSGTIFLHERERDGIAIRNRINKNQRLIYSLAHKAFLEEKLKRINYNLGILNGKKKLESIEDDILIKNLYKNIEVLNTDWVVDIALMGRDLKGERTNAPNPVSDGRVRPVNIAETIDEIFPYRRDLSIERITIADWANMPYCENTKYIENKIHKASNGLKTRSKSESIIMDIYISKGIPFHYDETIKIGDKLVSPDFISLRNDGTLVIHEHAGVWSVEYVDRLIEKVSIYAHAGFIPGKNLLITYDNPNGGINTRLISELVDDMYNR